MNNNIIEIISLLIQKMLTNDDLFIEEENLVQELLDLGYQIEDIDQALELIFSSTDIIDRENVDEFKGYYNRVFTVSEKIYLPVYLQGLIKRLIILNVLTPKESEKLISKTIQNTYTGSTETSDIWDILKEIVDDQSKLEIISQEIPEFKDFFRQNFKYVN